MELRGEEVRKVNVLAGFALLLGLLGAGQMVASKEKSDKERIEILEKQVSALNEAVSDQGADLAGEHQWALSVNSVLQQLMNRGPVAKR